jgi:hypothetical protein
MQGETIAYFNNYVKPFKINLFHVKILILQKDAASSSGGFFSSVEE